MKQANGPDGGRLEAAAVVAAECAELRDAVEAGDVASRDEAEAGVAFSEIRGVARVSGHRAVEAQIAAWEAVHVAGMAVAPDGDRTGAVPGASHDADRADLVWEEFRSVGGVRRLDEDVANEAAVARQTEAVVCCLVPAVAASGAVALATIASAVAAPAANPAGSVVGAISDLDRIWGPVDANADPAPGARAAVPDSTVVVDRHSRNLDSSAHIAGCDRNSADSCCHLDTDNLDTGVPTDRHSADTNHPGCPSSFAGSAGDFAND